MVIADAGCGRMTDREAEGWARARQKRVPGGNDRKKGQGKGFDAKGAKGAKFRHVKTGSGGADSRGNDRRKGKSRSGSLWDDKPKAMRRRFSGSVGKIQGADRYVRRAGGGGFPKRTEFVRLADGACTFRRLLWCVWLIDGWVMSEGTIRSPRNRFKGKADGANLRREAWTLSKETVCRRKMQLR